MRREEIGLLALLPRQPKPVVGTWQWQPSNVRDQIAQLNVDYQAFDADVRSFSQAPNSLRAGWIAQKTQWDAFVLENQKILSITPLNAESKIRNVAMYRDALSSWRASFAQEGFVALSPIPITPPNPNSPPEFPWGILAFLTGTALVGTALYKWNPKQSSSMARRSHR